jgi:hypothetical protein
MRGMSDDALNASDEWQVYRNFQEWRVALYQGLREMHPDELEALLGDMRQTQERIEAAQIEVKARHQVKTAKYVPDVGQR